MIFEPNIYLCLMEGISIDDIEIDESNRSYYYDQGYKKLKELTGQDFGDNINDWRDWIDENLTTIGSLLPDKEMTKEDIEDYNQLMRKLGRPKSEEL